MGDLNGSTPSRNVRVEDEVFWYSVPSPDGQRLIVESVSGWTGIWDAAEKRFLVTRRSQDLSSSFNFFWSPDQKSIFSIHNDHTLRAWDSNTLRAIGVVKNTSNKQFCDVHFEPDGESLFTASLDGEIRRWFLPLRSNESQVLARSPVQDQLHYQVISPDGKTVVAGFEDGNCFLWDIANSKVLFKLAEPIESRQPTSRNYSADFSSDGSCVAVVTDLVNVTIYDAKEGTAICELSDHAAFIRTVTFSANSKRLMTVSEDGLAKIWHVKSPPSPDQRTFENAHDDIVFQIAIGPAGRQLLTGSFDGSARVWDLHTETLLATYERHQAEIIAVDISNNGAKASTLDSTGSLHVWNANDGTAIFAIPPLSDEFSKLIRQSGAGIRREVLNFPAPLSTGLFSPDDSCVVLFQRDSMKVFDAETGIEKLALDGANNCGWPVFSHDSSMVSVLENNARATGVWSLENGRRISSLEFGRASLCMLDFNPNNYLIAGGGMNGRTVVWDAESGVTVAKLKRESSFVTGCRFTPDGKYVLSGDGSRVAVWDVATNKLATSLEGHSSRIRDVRISPDGSRFVSWGMDDKVIVWDFQKPTAIPLMAIDGESTLLQVQWSPDGRDLITSWANGSIKVFKGSTKKLLEDLEFDPDEFESGFRRWRNRSMNLISSQ